MSLQQKNSTTLQKIKELVATTNKYNLTPALKKHDGFVKFVMNSTSHFPKERTLSFRARALAEGNDCKCLCCGNIVKQYGNKYLLETLS